MNITGRAILLALLSLLPAFAQAEIILKGKISSRVTGHVIKANNLFVTDEKGGWYDQGVAMDQSGGFSTPYEVELPLRVTSSSGVFQVSMDTPLVLQNETKPELQFRNMSVKMAQVGEVLQPLAVANQVQFRNPAAAAEGEDTVGHYLLDISGYPPAGEFKQVTGNYTGVLSLTFEPVLEE